MTKEYVNWGIIGPGRIARQFAESIKLLPDAKVAAAGSRDVARAKEFTDVYGGTPYGSYQEMVNDPAVDIVYVATPHPMHEEHVVLAANAGKAVLCEKPFAVTYQSAQNMVNAAKQNNVFLMECLWSRFFPLWKEVIKLVDDGAIGTVTFIESAMAWGLRQPVDPANRLVNPDLAGGGLLDAGAYPLSAVFNIMKGKLPDEIHSVSHLNETGVDDDMAILFKYTNPDVLAQLRCGLRSPGNETKIIGDKGSITVYRHRDPDHYTINQNRDGYRARVEQNVEIRFPAFGFQYVAEAVMDCFRQGLKECPLVPWQQTLDIARISEDLRHKAGVWYPFEKKV